jgi:HTH-type transcriptional regulator, sugar sensing transcriptional regulator
MMRRLPTQLLISLTELGLLESEAKIYAALVVLQSAEVRDLLEFLDVSKPRVYDGLRKLEESGLIVLTSPRPATYQAIEPRVALELILKKHQDAKREALKEFKILKKEEIITEHSSPLWFIFGAKSFEFKIKDMLGNARESVYCQTSGKYLEYIEKVAKKNIKIDLLIVDGQDTKKRLEHLSKKSNVKIQIIEKSQILEHHHHETETELQQRSRANLKDIIDLDNMFTLVVDDSELLTIPPLKTDSLSAITSTNKVLIFSTKMQREEALLAYESGK